VLLLVAAACTKSTPRPALPPATSSTASTATASPSGASASPSGTVPPVEFADCTDQFRRAINNPRANSMTFSCGKLPVPLDYSKPTGTTINLFVVKVHSTRQQPSARIGSLLVNPGGPGNSGVNLAAGLVVGLSDAVFDHFDLVGFDPRGVGLSTPLTCITDRQKDQSAALNADVRTPAGRTLARSNADSIARACAAKYGPALAHYNTEETARDMDRIRAAVGDAKLNYLGFSYGTRLGATYAHQFPTRIRAAVLDGAVDPVADELTTDERQVKAFEDAFDQFAADCLKRPACAVLGNPRSVVTTLIKQADRVPLSSSKQGETRKATGGIVTTGVLSALYDQGQWKELGNALIAARRGDAQQLFALADQYNERDADTGHYSNVLDANLAVNCNDSTLKITDALVATTGAQWIAKYPIFGANGAASLYACHAWPKSGHPLPPASAPGSPPIVVIGTVHDPATPYAAAGVMARALGNGVLLSWDGEGHTAYPKTTCITNKVNSYLITAKVPAGNSCPRN
jgi:pimeloyl-ACP methyl ester carboxylesterase